LDIRRGEQELKLTLEQQVLPGAGTLRGWREDDAALDRFFALGG
jgi:hypothetical protein